ncbi:hypothetical protein YC2023_054641 [Brassica napus]|uniref:(rape) hypothetical protein n=1 Tax=Brassica napus TaxID=3708 RepID=A0A816JVL6_BRANA|nr:unnamed protein product [Brassica napus]
MKRSGELMGIDMIFVNAKSTLVQDSTWAHLAQNFEAPAEGRCHLTPWKFPEGQRI